MRLTCPNCGAQYEVPEAAIPAAGRNVQCSACGEAWVQNRPEEAHTGAEQARPEQGPPPAPNPEPAPAASPTLGPAQRRLDPEVADILRTEAARERAKRAAASTGDVGTHGDPAPTSQQATLPDPDGIKASLDPSRDRATQSRPEASMATSTAPAHSGFRAGFWVALIACGLAAGVYLAAPELIGMVPEAEAPIERYVAAIDGARLRLDAFFERMMAQISGG